MPLKFYLVAKQVALQLRKRGVDVIHCQEVGKRHDTDEEHLEYTTEQNRVMVTMDDDFLSLHVEWNEEGKTHAGIIFSPELQG